MAQIQLQKISSEILTPATPEASEFLQRIKIGEWIHADFKRVRNYQFHKRFLNFSSSALTTGRRPAALFCLKSKSWLMASSIFSAGK